MSANNKRGGAIVVDEVTDETQQSGTLDASDEADVAVVPSCANGTVDTDVARITQIQTKKDHERSATTSFLNGPYTQREFGFVIFAGVFLAFNSGYVNGSCLSGFVVLGRQQAVASFTGTYTKSALALADGNYDDFGFFMGMILSFLGGACLAGLMTPNPTAWRIEPSYGPSILLGAAFLIGSSILAALERNQDFVFYLTAAASGIQNGLSSSYSGNLIRSTGYTGGLTDISVFLAQLCRGNHKNTWKLIVLLCLITAFWIGGFVSFYATRRFTSYSLLFNASLFVMIGGSLVAFLTYELGVSVKQAVLGQWKWKQTMDKLHDTFIIAQQDDDDHSNNKFLNMSLDDRLDFIFESVDTDHSESIDSDELWEALQKVGAKITKRESLMMLKRADADGNGTISRDEWREIARDWKEQSRKYIHSSD